MNAERFARLLAAGLSLGVILAALAAGWLSPDRPGVVEIHARAPQAGGWLPGDLKAQAGEPLRLRLVSDDVVHGFAIGQSEQAPLDLLPGKAVETTLVFERPGTYTFYCTRWCGPDHWRMRGVIEVTGEAGEATRPSPPLYERLGIDLDAPHPASAVPPRKPSAERGAALGIDLPAKYLAREYRRSRSPSQAWQELRANPATSGLSDEQVWDLTAWLWMEPATQASLDAAGQLFAQNCAACHGESGAGDGVVAASLQAKEAESEGFATERRAPADFTDSASALGASPALLQGKILRGGMGSGMPSWGAILSEEQTWALVDFLWTFQFEAGP